MDGCSYSELKGKRTIIVGDVGTGKTLLTKRLLIEAINQSKESITVLDFAPQERTVNGVKVGGYLCEDSLPHVRYYRSKLMKTPRLSAKDGVEVIKLADYNKDITEHMLHQFLESPTEILFINDTSIHLQRGNLQTLWNAIIRADTVVANGYLGEHLRQDHGTGVSRRERLLMQQLATEMDNVIRLGNVQPQENKEKT